MDVQEDHGLTPPPPPPPRPTLSQAKAALLAVGEGWDADRRERKQRKASDPQRSALMAAGIAALGGLLMGRRKGGIGKTVVSLAFLTRLARPFLPMIMQALLKRRS